MEETHLDFDALDASLAARETKTDLRVYNRSNRRPPLEPSEQVAMCMGFESS